MSKSNNAIVGKSWNSNSTASSTLTQAKLNNSVIKNESQANIKSPTNSEPNRGDSFSTALKQSDRPTSNEIIVIHVCDENRKLNKDFKCEKNLLLANMKYFEKYLSGASSIDDIDISVHCDINIFEWLMKYVNNNEEPKLELSNVISILISSDFL
jgi:hypothetical protein